MRAALALMALFLLTGCNVVLTKAPLFTAADEAGAPPMKAGVWAFEDSDCTFDATKPMTAWPDCAGGGVVMPGQIAGHDKKDGKDVWQSLPFILATGTPRVAQVMFEPTMSDLTPGTKPGEAKQPPYGYAGVKPTAHDTAGAITAITYWVVQCGPPPPPAKNPKDTMKNLGTHHPLPGMVMKPGDPVCTTTSKVALRGAAKASEAWADKLMHAHWVRAAGLGDLAP